MYNKVSRISLYFVLALAFFIQLNFLDYIKVWGVKPDLMTLAVVFFALFFGVSTGVEAGFAAGLLKDIFSTDLFGVNTLTLALVGLIVGLSSPKFFKESAFTQVLLVFTFTVLSMMAHFLLLSLKPDTPYASMGAYVFRLMIPTGIYTALISAAVFPALIKSYGLNKREEFL